MSERRYPLDALVAASGLTEHALGAKVGLSGSSLKTARRKGLSEAQADRYAVRAGLIPWVVWPEWLDHAIEDASVPCEECGAPFVPSRRGHRFCTRRCYERSRAKKRYRDPAYRQQRAAYVARYRREAAEAIRANKRRWIEANRERVRRQSREAMRRWRAKQHTTQQEDVA